MFLTVECNEVETQINILGGQGSFNFSANEPGTKYLFIKDYSEGYFMSLELFVVEGSTGAV